MVLKTSNVAKESALLQARLIRRYLDPMVVAVVGPEVEGDRATTTALLEAKFDVRKFILSFFISTALWTYRNTCTLMIRLCLRLRPCVTSAGGVLHGLARRGASGG